MRGRCDPGPDPLRPRPARRHVGPPPEGLDHGRRAVALLERAREPWWIGPGPLGGRLEPRVLGEFEAALDAEVRAVAFGREVGDSQVISSAAWASGLVHVCRGDSGDGHPQLRKRRSPARQTR